MDCGSDVDDSMQVLLLMLLVLLFIMLPADPHRTCRSIRVLWQERTSGATLQVMLLLLLKCAAVAALGGDGRAVAAEQCRLCCCSMHVT
jgi:hypothetical protein